MVHINGFSVGQRSEIGVTTYRVPDTDVLLPVRGEIAPLLIGLAAEFHRRVEPLRSGECWGYAFREVRGGSTPSFHAAGIAVDLNAPSHPLGVRNTFNTEQMGICRALARKYGCRWGGDYRRRADEMHFEVIVPRAQARRLVDGGVSPIQESAPEEESMKRGDKGDQVKALQFVLVEAWKGRPTAIKIGQDGVYGANTETAVKSAQRYCDLPQTGVADPVTVAAVTTAYMQARFYLKS